MKKLEIQIYDDAIPLAGDERPTPPHTIDELLAYLGTVKHRFGNTAVDFESLRWGSRAIQNMDHDCDYLDNWYQFLIQLHDALRNVPAMYGIDGYHLDMIVMLAAEIKSLIREG